MDKKGSAPRAKKLFDPETGVRHQRSHTTEPDSKKVFASARRGAGFFQKALLALQVIAWLA
jgi:hypothetical protein